MLSFLSLLLFAGVCLSVVSAELIPASTDPCNLNEDLTIDVRYPVEDPDDVRCGAERELEDVNGRDAPEVGIQMKDELEYLEDFLGMEGRGDDQVCFFHKYCRFLVLFVGHKTQLSVSLSAAIKEPVIFIVSKAL